MLLIKKNGSSLHPHSSPRLCRASASPHPASCFHLLHVELLLSFQLHASVVAASSSSLSNSSLSALSKTGMSCDHLRDTSCLQGALLQNFRHFYFIFFSPSLLSRFLTQDSQERSATAPTERPVGPPPAPPQDGLLHGAAASCEAQIGWIVSVCGGSVVMSLEKTRPEVCRSVLVLVRRPESAPCLQ